MKVDSLTVTAGITRDVDTKECKELIELYQSGESVFGLVDQFSWMPFIVTGVKPHGNNMMTFNLMMVNK